jgi:hypothetical protein
MNLEPPKIGQIAEAISAWNPAANEKLGHAHEIFSALLGAIWHEPGTNRASAGSDGVGNGFTKPWACLTGTGFGGQS